MVRCSVARPLPTLTTDGLGVILRVMSVAELQKTIAKLPADQQRTVAKFVTRLKKSTSPARQRQLARSMREMDAGIKYTREDVMKARVAFRKAHP